MFNYSCRSDSGLLLEAEMNVAAVASNAKHSPPHVASVSTIKSLIYAIIPLAKPDAISHADLSELHAKSRKVVETLFPSCSLDELSSMSREALIAKAQSLSPSSVTPSPQDPPEDDLRDLEPPPERDFTWDEVSDDDTKPSRVADDINGLAVSLDSLNSHNASYLGFSSVPTILRVIAHLSPRIRQVVPAPESWKASIVVGGSPDSTASSDIDELALINAYFLHVHPITPMIDEVDFRQRYVDGGVPEAQTGAWLALYNMVLAMGCFASDTSQFNKHNTVYKRAMSYLSLSSFGSGHLYTVQALALYGGYLLHYMNKPNMASAVIGATIRMAVAMGLHRVQIPEYFSADTKGIAHNSIITRVRTWWSIFCLDTWAAATLGRPGLGYWNSATVLTSSTSSLASLDYGTISLAASEQFCKIATRIHERLVQTPLITPGEISELDQDLLAWRDSLHMFFANREHCPSHLRVARGLLWCRFMTTRLTLYRPYLLSAALHRKQGSEASQKGRSLAVQCVEIARDAIEVIGLDWFPNHILSWNDAWHLFQICLVLVLAAVSVNESVDGSDGGDEYIARALNLFARMEPFNAGATRSRRVIQLLYDNIRNQEIKESDILDSSIFGFLDMEMGGNNDPDWLGFLCGYD
ncbi:hypothetical protein FE257_009218 [Aspergillus nanangensis]|uniref:Xylanolytic transcriptional activator regulatory domain-containing protein n=1 Tax=Aspergillus nanangensis TaxID=2582783 RepID=A0AAD4GU85_ASPNN|nr:hypothetical protein FE257_009218 [Aspergillus nanangensis]